jgi:transposase-like protein
LFILFFLQLHKWWDVHKRAMGVWGGEAGKKAKTTPDAGEKSVSEKSQATRTCRNPFEKSKSKQTEFFVREVKDKRMTKNGPEFLIG